MLNKKIKICWGRSSARMIVSCHFRACHTCTVAASPLLSRSMSSGRSVDHFWGKSWLEMTDSASLSCARTRGGVDSMSPVSRVLICSCMMLYRRLSCCRHILVVTSFA